MGITPSIMIGAVALIALILSIRVAHQTINHIAKCYYRIEEINLKRTYEETKLKERTEDLEDRVNTISPGPGWEKLPRKETQDDKQF